MRYSVIWVPFCPGSLWVPPSTIPTNGDSRIRQPPAARWRGMPESGVLDRPSCCLPGDETRIRPVTEGHDFTGEYWGHHYREPDPHSHPSAPNQHLLALTENLQPGRALDAGCGEGVDALR